MKPISTMILTLLVIGMASCASVQPEREYKLSPGEEFVIKLESNPSTGYQWRITKGLEKSGISLMEESYTPKPNPTNKPRLGAGGTKSWKFETNKKGRYLLKFVYQRPGEEEPVQTKHFAVRVK